MKGKFYYRFAVIYKDLQHQEIVKSILKKAGFTWLNDESEDLHNRNIDDARSFGTFERTIEFSITELSTLKEDITNHIKSSLMQYYSDIELLEYGFDLGD